MENKKELTLERTFDAPRKVVWNAWTVPKLVMQWWGPRNVDIPECEIDLRVGGKIYIVMQAGEGMGKYKGTRWQMLGEFTVVEPKSHFVYKVNAWTEGNEKDSQIDQTTEVSFAEDGDKTKVTVKATVHKVGPAATMALEGMEYGFNQQLDKFGEFLAKEREGKGEEKEK